jgi:hypothetical protein
MDWIAILGAIKAACAAATGMHLVNVQLETERGGHNRDGRRCRLDFDMREVGIDYVEHLDAADVASAPDGADGLIAAVVGNREIGVTFWFFSDNHASNETWAHSLASRLTARMNLPTATALLEAQDVVYLRPEDIQASPAATIDQRQMSVASARLIFGLAICEAASDAPAADDPVEDYFTSVELVRVDEESTLISSETVGPV